MVFRLFSVLAALATLSGGPASAAVMQAFWSGQVTAAEDATAVLFQNASSLIGTPVTLTVTYDAARARPIGGGQSLDSSNLYGDAPAFITQSLLIGGQSIAGFTLLNQSVRMYTYPITFDMFGVSGSSVQQFNSTVTVRQLRAQIADFSDFIIPEYLNQPFVWQGGPLQYNTGQLTFTSTNFRENTTLFSASASFRWDSVTVSRLDDLSPVPGPASGLLLVTALLGGALTMRHRKRASA